MSISDLFFLAVVVAGGYGLPGLSVAAIVFFLILCIYKTLTGNWTHKH